MYAIKDHERKLRSVSRFTRLAGRFLPRRRTHQGRVLRDSHGHIGAMKPRGHRRSIFRYFIAFFTMQGRLEWWGQIRYLSELQGGDTLKNHRTNPRMRTPVLLENFHRILGLMSPSPQWMSLGACTHSRVAVSFSLLDAGLGLSSAPTVSVQRNMPESRISSRTPRSGSSGVLRRRVRYTCATVHVID